MPLKIDKLIPSGINVEAVEHSIAIIQELGKSFESEADKYSDDDDHIDDKEPEKPVEVANYRSQSIDVKTMKSEITDNAYEVDKVDYSEDNDEADAGEKADKMTFESPMPPSKNQDPN